MSVGGRRVEQHQAAHLTSLTRALDRSRKPRGLGEYLAWFRERWDDEEPGSMHQRGVYIGTPEPGLGSSIATVSELSGGSHLGSPAIRPTFKRYLEGSPWATEQSMLEGQRSIERHYLRPLRATLARLRYQNPDAVDWLVAVARSGFDYQAVAVRRGFTPGEAALLLESAYYLAWREYQVRVHQDLSA